MEELNKALPIINVKIPESIAAMRKERDDITLFMSSIGDEFRKKKISAAEYEGIRKKNKDKLDEIEKGIRAEWEKIQPLLAASQPAQPQHEQLP